MVKLYIPKYEDLWFREMFLKDSDTMSYNNAWGGVVDFKKEDWEDWYDFWIRNEDRDHKYRYLVNENNIFVGEVAYHFDKGYQSHMADVIIYSKYRKRGYGKEGLKLLLDLAKESNIKVMCDDIAKDNSAIEMFLKFGFSIEYEADQIIMLKKEL